MVSEIFNGECDAMVDNKNDIALNQGLWRIEYLNTGRANSPKMWLFSLLNCYQW